MMLTFRARKLAIQAVFVFLVAACSREQQDWRSAEAADTVESYGQFLDRHPDSELATQARTRVAQLAEEREWKQASTTDTADAYREFLTQHPNGKWAQEARIRIQNFALNGLPPAGPAMAAAPEPTAGTTAAAAPPANGAAAVAAPDRLARAAGVAQMQGGQVAQMQPGSAPRAALSAQAAPGELAQPADSAQIGGVARGAGSLQAAGPTPGVAVGPASATARGTAASPTNSTSAPPPVSPRPPVYSTPSASAQVTTQTNFSTQRGAPPNSAAGYGVQLGAFGSDTAANNAWQQLQARFGAQLQGLTPHIVAANTSTGTLFRLQAQVADEAHARSLCDMLRQQSQACVPVLPH